jgi:hypothetical protein
LSIKPTLKVEIIFILKILGRFMSVLSKFAASFAAVVRHRERLGTDEDRKEEGGLRDRLAHQALILRDQAMEECQEDHKLVSFMKLANVTLALFNVPHGESFHSQMMALEAEIQSFSSVSPEFEKIVSL